MLARPGLQPPKLKITRPKRRMAVEKRQIEARRVEEARRIGAKRVAKRPKRKQTLLREECSRLNG